MIMNEERVFQALAKLCGAATGREIAEAMGDNWNAIRVGQTMRFDLVPSGRVERLATGVYRIRSTYSLMLR